MWCKKILGEKHFAVKTFWRKNFWRKKFFGVKKLWRKKRNLKYFLYIYCIFWLIFGLFCYAECLELWYNWILLEDESMAKQIQNKWNCAFLVHLHRISYFNSTKSRKGLFPIQTFCLTKSTIFSIYYIV